MPVARIPAVDQGTGDGDRQSRSWLLTVSMHDIHVRPPAGGGADRQLPATFTAVPPGAQIGWLSFAIHRRDPKI
jgi:hypothetical protein